MKRLIAVLAAALLMLAASPFSSAGAQIADLGTSSLAECLRTGGRGLAVLFMVDTSQSLLRTDRRQPPARVEGLQAAVRNLEAVAATRPVAVDVLEFGTDAQRAFPDRWQPWAQLSGRSGELASLMGEFAGRTSAEDTDYGAALIAGRAALAEAPAGACRLVVWFTDGEFDLDYLGRPKTVSWLNPPVELRSDGDEAAAERAAVEQICAAGGLADRFRQPGGAGAVAQSSAFVVGVSLGGGRYELLDRIVGNADSSCGTTAGAGYRLAAEGVDTLANQLIRASDPPVATAATDTFRLPESVERLRLRTAWDPSGPAPLLYPADGGPAIPLGAGSVSMPAGGVRVTITRETVDQSSVLIDTTTAPPGAWAGTWRIGGDGSSTPRLEPLMLQEASGELRLAYRGGSPLRRGRPSEVVAAITNSAGTPRSGEAAGDAGAFALSITAPVTAELGERAADGTLRIRTSVPIDFRPDQVELTARVAPKAVILTGTTTALRQWSGSIGPDAGPLVVKDLPRHPLVDPPSAVDGTLDQDHRSVTASIPVVAIGPESAGCIAVESASFAGADETGAQVRIFDGERPVPTDGSCTVELADAEERALRIEISVDKDGARTARTVTAAVRFRSQGATDPSDLETFDYELAATVTPLTVTENPGVLDFAPFVALALALPIGMLYGYNALLGARLRVSAGFVASAPVILRHDTTIVPATGDGHTQWRLDHGELQPLFATPGPARTLTAGHATYRARVPRSPFGAPRCEVTVPGATLVVSTGRSSAKGRVGRAELALSRSWVFSATTVHPVDPDSPGGAGPGQPGNLIVLLPRLPTGAGVEFFENEFDALVTEAGRRSLDVVLEHAAHIHAEEHTASAASTRPDPAVPPAPAQPTTGWSTDPFGGGGSGPEPPAPTSTPF